MKIKLLLNNISHEQQAPSDEEVAFVGWLHMPAAGPDGGNIINQDTGAASDSAIGHRRLPPLSLRKESWGGLLVHGPSSTVYQLDEEAYHLFTRLKNGEKFDDIINEIESFRAELKSFGMDF